MEINCFSFCCWFITSTCVKVLWRFEVLNNITVLFTKLSQQSDMWLDIFYNSRPQTTGSVFWTPAPPSHMSEPLSHSLNGSCPYVTQNTIYFAACFLHTRPFFVRGFFILSVSCLLLNIFVLSLRVTSRTGHCLCEHTWPLQACVIVNSIFLLFCSLKQNNISHKTLVFTG